MNDSRLRQRVSLQHPRESLPHHVVALRSTVQPALPLATHRFVEAFQSTTIPGEPVVLVMPAQLRNEVSMLIGNLAMPVAPEPLRHLSDRSCQSALRRLLPDRPSTATSTPPVVSEPEQIERSRPIAPVIGRPKGRSRKAHQTSLLGMKRQTVLAKSLGSTAISFSASLFIAQTITKSSA